ncbi:MAG: CidA/LrgA family protein [Oscillospiraceae bacterium]|nr:CidA/LrgA family protein [Oscillospiraceae bacterium]
MKILVQLTILFTICLVGQLIAGLLPIPVPGSVISMVILLLLLLFRLLKPVHIQETAEFLLKNMAFFFVPAGVQILEKYTFLQGHVLVFALICIVTTLLTFLVTALTVTGVIKLQEKFQNRGVSHDGSHQ